MRMFLAVAAVMAGVFGLLMLPKWLSYTADVHVRKQREALDRRWFKQSAE